MAKHNIAYIRQVSSCFEVSVTACDILIRGVGMKVGCVVTKSN